MGNGAKKRLESVKTEHLGVRYMDLFYKRYTRSMNKEEKRELKEITQVLYEREYSERINGYNMIQRKINFLIRQNLTESILKIYEDMKLEYRLGVMG